jgi:hypothetical protein
MTSLDRSKQLVLNLKLSPGKLEVKQGSAGLA